MKIMISFRRTKLIQRTNIIRYNAFSINRLTNLIAHDDINYVRKTPHEHVLLRPGMYVGETNPVEKETWIFNESEMVMERRKIRVSPALIKIFDEALVNAADNRYKDSSMSTIEVNLHIMDGKFSVSVRNNGFGVPVIRHKDEPDLYIPGLVFGHLLTGSNFDDDKAQLTGGRHGYGAKLANIFSQRFIVSTADSRRGLRYDQTWEKNMTVCHPPSITEINHSAKDFTEVTFFPDLTKFHTRLSNDGNTDSVSVTDAVMLMRRRAVDMAACVRGITVSVNGEKLPVTDFSDYVALFRPLHRVDASTGLLLDAHPDSTEVGFEDNLDDMQPAIPLTDDFIDGSDSTAVMEQEPVSRAVPINSPVMYCSVSDRWDVAVGLSPSGEFEQVSFVNGVWTSLGGSHVELVTSQVVSAVRTALLNLSPPLQASPRLVRARLSVFLRCDVESATFNSQTKDELTTPVRLFGSSCDLPEGFLAAVVSRSGVMEDLVMYLRAKERRDLDRGSKSTKQKAVEIPKLEDAHFAASRRAMECTLILTEGDSAKALAVAGLEAVGRDLYGVMPLRGKLLNVQELTHLRKKVRANVELANLTKALGLKYSRQYNLTDDPLEWHKQGLRYGRILIMADLDHDGSHIKGLVINFINTFWPNLLERDGFIQQFITPLIKAKSPHSNAKKDKAEGVPQKWFYSLQEFDAWRRSSSVDMAPKEAATDTISVDPSTATVKYYKGLGTSTAAEGREYFGAIDSHVKDFYSEGGHDAAIKLAFGRSGASQRRHWLEHSYISTSFLDPVPRRVSYEDFINKELIHFSQASNIRAIPHVIDGLKPSQRKVLYSCFKRKLDKEIKVVQLAGYVAEQTAYHHGEASLHATIINMAQDYVGANNVPLLLPSGQFGSRARGGKDFASPRYIYTQLSPMARLMFPEADDEVLDYLEEDNQLVEPRYYVPVVPTLLVNGATGVGTGWSTSVPAHNLVDVIDRVERRVTGAVTEGLVHMLPYYRGYKGRVTWAEGEGLDGSVAKSCGNIERVDARTICITELPIGVWTEDYKSRLVKMLQSKLISKFQEYHTSASVSFVVTVTKRFWTSITGSETNHEETNTETSIPHSLPQRKRKTVKVRSKDKRCHNIDTESLDSEVDVTEENELNEKLIKAFHLNRNISYGNMTAFGVHGGISRYSSTQSILDAHHDVRLELYTRRRLALLDKLSRREAHARNCARFVDAVVAGTVPLHRPGGGPLLSLETESMLLNLGFETAEELGYSAGAIGGVGRDSPDALRSRMASIDRQGSSDSVRPFAYLLDLPLTALTLERVQQMRRRAEIAKDSLEQLKQSNAIELWIRDLNSLRIGAKEFLK